jgi:hypothetical protein
VLVTRERRTALAGLAAAGLVLGLVFLAGFGEPLWASVVEAQAQTGRASLRYVAALWAQAGWNAAGLIVLAALAWRGRAALTEPDLARSLLAASLGSLLLLATLLKHGSYLTVMVVAEPPLLCLAACGVAVVLRELGAGGQPRRLPALAAAAAIGLLVAQAGSLLLAPADPALFTRPFAATRPGRALSDAEVGRLAAAIRRCPAAATYLGPPYLAFVAGRPIAGGQPDPFLIASAADLARFRSAVQNDRAVCASAPVPSSSPGDRSAP